MYPNPTPQTLKRAIEVSGRGLHSNLPCTVRLVPVNRTEGLSFVHTPTGKGIPVHASRTGEFRLATSLVKGGVRLQTVEHLLSALRGCGIDAFSMAINEHFGRAPFARPNGFYWQGATGQSILAWNGLHYNANHFFGIPYDVEATVAKLPELSAWLKARNYAHDFLMFQVTRRDFPDNGGR